MLLHGAMFMYNAGRYSFYKVRKVNKIFNTCSVAHDFPLRSMYIRCIHADEILSSTHEAYLKEDLPLLVPGLMSWKPALPKS